MGFLAVCFLAASGINSRLLRNAQEQEQDLKTAETQSAQESGTEADIPVNQISKPEYKYIIFSEDGELVVYYADNTTVFFHSGIREESLPEELKERLWAGISFASEEELYEFLENYSS
jgi:outer membrane usher protein FimD/PapC